MRTDFWVTHMVVNHPSITLEAFHLFKVSRENHANLPPHMRFAARRTCNNAHSVHGQTSKLTFFTCQTMIQTLPENIWSQRHKLTSSWIIEFNHNLFKVVFCLFLKRPTTIVARKPFLAATFDNSFFQYLWCLQNCAEQFWGNDE